MRFGRRASYALLCCLTLVALAVLAAPYPAHVKGAPVVVANPPIGAAAPNPEIDRGPATVPARGGRTVVHTVTAVRGDTVIELLVAAGSSQRDAVAAITALKTRFNPRTLRVGQELVVVFDAGDVPPKLVAVNLALGKSRYLVVRRNGRGFSAARARAPFVPRLVGPAAVASQRAPIRELDDAVRKTVNIRKGDTLAKVLLHAGSNRRETYAAITALSRHYSPRRLQVGQELTMVFDAGAAGARRKLAAVGLALGGGSFVVASRGENGEFTSQPVRAPLSATIDTVLFAAASAPPPEAAFAPEPEDAMRKNVRVRSGDTLMNALLRAGCERAEAHAAIAALSELYNPRKLKVGQMLTVVLASNGADRGPLLHGFTLAAEPGRIVKVGRSEHGGFAAREVEMPLASVLVHAGGRIESSLYRAATKAGVPTSVMMDMIRAFSFDVDFQREIQRGDDFVVLFARYLDEAGAVVREGAVSYAALTLRGQPLKIYRYTTRDGFTDYYNEKGHSVRKALLRTPIDGARLSSGYGKRKHPILGFTKMHRGVDFAAPNGAVIVAAGDGVVEQIGWNGNYGRYIRIRHRGQYSTAYAHLSRIAKSLYRGRRIEQGEVIGRVGSSGRSTGPHLHYEVLRNGRQINPLRVKLPAGARLKGAELAAFQATRRKIERELAARPLVQRVADGGLPSAVCGGSRQASAIDVKTPAEC